LLLPLAAARRRRDRRRKGLETVRGAKVQMRTMEFGCKAEGAGISIKAPEGDAVVVEKVQVAKSQPPYMLIFAVRWRVYFVALGFFTCEKTRSKMLRYAASVFRAKVAPDENDLTALAADSEHLCAESAKLYQMSPVEVPYNLPKETVAGELLRSQGFTQMLCELFLQFGFHTDVETKTTGTKQRLAKGKHSKSAKAHQHLRKLNKTKAKQLGRRDAWVQGPQGPRWFLHRHAAPRRSCESSIAFDVIQDFLMDNPSTQVHIGIDSKRYGNHVVFACAVVLYRPGCGGRVVSRLMTKAYPSPPQPVTRLWEEVSEAMEIAETVAKVCEPCDKVRNRIHVHLDLNSDERCVSHEVYKPGLKWVRSMGFNAYGKPAAWAASGVANRLTNQAVMYC